MTDLQLTMEDSGDFGQYFVNGKRRFIVYLSIDNQWCITLTRKGDSVLIGKRDTFSQADFLVNNLYPHIKGS